MILEALRLFPRTFQYKLIVKSEKWVSLSNLRPWRYQFLLNEIKELSSHLYAVFCLVLGSANSWADGPALEGQVEYLHGWPML